MRSASVLLASGAALVFVLALGSHLPDPVTSHFGVTGAPDAFMSRHWLVLVVASLVSVVPTLTWWLVTWSARRGKANIPNASFWFSPDRREETAQYLSVFASRLGVLLAVFLSFNFWLLVQANAAGAMAAHLNVPTFLIGLATFLVITVASAVALQRRFRKPDA